MSARHLLAIDVGTQSARAIVFDAAGNLLAKTQEFFEPPYRSPQPGWAEQEVEVYWRALVRCCRRLWTESALRPEAIAGLALTTLRGSVVCADAQGRALRPAILWLDQRRCTSPPLLGPWWNALFAVAGARDLIGHVQAQAQANWLAEHEPELWRATEKFVLLSGYLTHRLCGEWVDSVASQVGYLPFDYRRLEWAAPGDFRWRALAVRREQLPRLLPPGARLGGLRADVAEELGLPAGLALFAAAADKACEVLGSGALAPDTAQLSFGTTATINTTQSRYVEVQARLPAYPAALPGHWNTEIQIYRGFWMVSWFKREFAHREQALAAERGVPAETLFDELLASVPPGAQGLVLQPYWSPGVREPGPEARGAVVGFSDAHTRAHFYRAIIEGLAYGLRAGKEQIERRLRRKLVRVIVSGGGSQSDQAMQITADVFGQPVERPPIYETAALGAAIDLAVGLGWYPDYPAAVAAMTRRGRAFQPRPEAVRTYQALYREVYRELYPRLRPLYRRLRTIAGEPPGSLTGR